MERFCKKCGESYDDAEGWTFSLCELLQTPEQRENFKLGLKLLGHRVRFCHLPDGFGERCIALQFDGLVVLQGWAGAFDPNIFIVDEPEGEQEGAAKNDRL